MLPQARRENLLVHELEGELVVYDRERHRATCLNPTAALVWRHCDGRRTVGDLATLLHEALNAPADENLVWLALDRLEQAHLLDGRLARPAALADASRRALLRKVGRTAALA